MFKDKLPGDRFFARLGRELDLECPRCGQIVSSRVKVHAKADDRSGFNPRTQHFLCSSCNLVLGIGILAWPLKRHFVGIPEDVEPTYREALQLRQQAGGLWLPESARQKATDPRNVVIVGGCTCEEVGGSAVTESNKHLWVNPGCPVHGHGVKT